MSEKKHIEEISQEGVATTASSAENFLVKNRKLLVGALAAVIVVGLGILCYSKFIHAPAVAEAQQNTYVAEMNFQLAEYELALNGDGTNLGFAQICDKYGNKAGKAVYFYAGICSAQLGQWEEALNYLKKYKGTEPILAARALALQADCYVALDNKAQAVKLYEKAASKSDNLFAADYLIKAGKVYSEMGQKEKALAAFKTVKDKYPMAVEASLIDKYINEVAE